MFIFIVYIRVELSMYRDLNFFSKILQIRPVWM